MKLLKKNKVSETQTSQKDDTEEIDCVSARRPEYPLPEEGLVEIDGRPYRRVVVSHDPTYNSVTSTCFEPVAPPPYNWGD